MKHYRDLEDLLYGIDSAFQYEFSVDKPTFNGVCNVVLSQENELHLDEIHLFGYGEIASVYVYLGSLIIEYSGKYILRYLLEKINASIAEIETNLQNFDLSKEDKETILSISKQVKADLPKLKIFEISTELIALEKKNFQLLEFSH